MLAKARAAAVPAPPPVLKVGVRARLVGLKSAALLNGQIAMVKGFDNTTQRFVVQIPDGTMKRVKAVHLVALAASGANSPGAAPSGPPVIPGEPAKRLSVCNAYAKHSPLQAFAISADGSQYTQVAAGLEYQSCMDVADFPESAGALSFVVDRLQVARVAFNSTLLGAGRGLEMVVHRNDVNSLKAKVHQNVVELADSKFYHLHIVNAYAGARLLELHVSRGSFEERLPLDKTYRLDKEQPISLTLTDGFEKLHLGFDPRKARTYTVITTGVDMGLRGEPRNVGLVAHEIGGWTSYEEMSGQDAPPSEPATPPVLFAPPEAAEPAEERHPQGLTWLLAKVSGGVASLLQH